MMDAEPVAQAAQLLVDHLAATGRVADSLLSDDRSPFLPLQQPSPSDDDGEGAAPRPDVIVLLGSSVLDCADRAAALYRDVFGSEAAASQDSAPPRRLLVSGGIGHSTAPLYDVVRADAAAHSTLPSNADDLFAAPTHGGGDQPRSPKVPEAAILREILVQQLNVPAAAVVLEDKSRNCGENAELSAPMLREMLRELQKKTTTGRRPVVALIQDPTMQRRTMLSFTKHVRSAFADAAPEDVPILVAAGHSHDISRFSSSPAKPPRRACYGVERLVSLLLGELPRLADAPGGYGPRGTGFIDQDEAVPEEVAAAAEVIATAFPAAAGR